MRAATSRRRTARKGQGVKGQEPDDRQRLDGRRGRRRPRDRSGADPQVRQQAQSDTDGGTRVSSHVQVGLLAATEPLLNALNDSRALFGTLIGSPLPDGWPEFPEVIGFTLAYLRTASDSDRSWSMQFFVDTSTGRLLGSGGFVAPPSGRTVEIGYEIAPEFRGRGLGAVAARALVGRAAASGEVDHVLAHTLPGPNPSTGVLVSLGFEHVDDHRDPEVGVVWEWRSSRPWAPGS